MGALEIYLLLLLLLFIFSLSEIADGQSYSTFLSEIGDEVLCNFYLSEIGDGQSYSIFLSRKLAMDSRIQFFSLGNWRWTVLFNICLSKTGDEQSY